MASEQEAWPSQSSPTPANAGGLTASKTTEQEFEETLGSLVDYYSTHTPGAIEAEARNVRAARVEQPVVFDANAKASAEADVERQREIAARVADRRERYQTVRVAPPRPPGSSRTWAWILGGALAMVIGGVATFALMVGPKDFWRMVTGKQKAQPQVAASTLPSPPPKTAAKGVPHAQPLGSGARARLAAPKAGSGSSGPRVIPLAPDTDAPSDTPNKGVAPPATEKAAGDHVTLRSAKTEAAARLERERAKRAAAKRARARAAKRPQHTRRAKRAVKRVRRPARRAKLSASARKRKGSGSDWEDPYK